jgi:hypothetical protein
MHPIFAFISLSLALTGPPGGAGTPTPTSEPVTATPTVLATTTPTVLATATPAGTATPCPIQFSDVPVGSPFYPFVRCLACRGIVSGYADGTFRPYAELTRGQICKLIANAAGWLDPIPSTQQTFEDVPPTHPFWLYAERYALHTGGLIGYSCGSGAINPCTGLPEVCVAGRSYLRPCVATTRGQLAKITANAAGWHDPIPSTQQTFEDVPSTNVFWLFIEQLALHGAAGGYSCGGPGEPCVPPDNRPYFRWGTNVTRGQAAKILANSFFPNCQTPAER